MVRFPHTGNIARTIFSECRTYRYTLYRKRVDLNPDPGTKVLFVMANPSIANEHQLDPTMKRAISFSMKLDCREFLAMNCFALVSTDPKGLWTHPNPVGPLNDVYLKTAAMWADRIVVAWGTLGTYKDRNREVLRVLDGYDLLCLGVTNEGHPRHPLYVRGDTEIIPYRWTNGNQKQPG